MLIRSLGFLLLFNRRDYAPGSTTSTDDILVGDREKISFINSQFTTELQALLDRDPTLRHVGRDLRLHTFATS